MMYHKPVLLHESIAGLNIKGEGVYVDVTYGGGGHSKEILKHLTTGCLFAFDQDDEAIANKVEDKKLVLIKQNFKYMKNFLRVHNALPVDGILADLGVSSHQFDTGERGFSTRFEGTLDMRMDRANKLTAAEVLNTYEESELIQIFKNYGEVENSRKLVSAIIVARQQKKIKTISEFKQAIQTCIPRGKEHQYLAKVFQALRIVVNNELEVLKDLLIQSREVLKPGGRLVVISYHSLEDRLVKNFMKSGNFEGKVQQDFYGNKLVDFRVITRQVITAGEEELLENSRARSAKLRIAEKV
ncbi:MAG: 16S rRNA (cytosine(1402)-N(4))-methyltransferase RsmH [Bacteroidia bacterium]|nr:16S rRNA (cytosine(1402)-N(4))-methyltransferase RsmH [Bacteroidia bacterium]MCZ2249392.1 16S rRNA (cytosine(1402)-N(4))-methyltransferase RsmH [Bacteroidia bacterium]